MRNVFVLPLAQTAEVAETEGTEPADPELAEVAEAKGAQAEVAELAALGAAGGPRCRQGRLTIATPPLLPCGLERAATKRGTSDLSEPAFCRERVTRNGN